MTVPSARVWAEATHARRTTRLTIRTGGDAIPEETGAADIAVASRPVIEDVRALETPFASSQLMARADALTRRAAHLPRPAEVLEVDGCSIDLGAHVASRGKTRIQLTAREVGVLRWLHTHRERAVSRAELLQHVWGLSPQMETRTVDVAIAGLRKKIERVASEPKIVTSVRGTGYRFGE